MDVYPNGRLYDLVLILKCLFENDLLGLKDKREVHTAITCVRQHKTIPNDL